MSSLCYLCGKRHPIDSELYLSSPATTDNGTPLPSMKKLYDIFKHNLNPHSSQGNKQIVDLRVKYWISEATRLCGRLWFYKFQMKEETDHTDPLLPAVQYKISEIAKHLCIKEEIIRHDENDRQEIEEYNLEQEKKATRKSLLESMTPEKRDAFLKKEEDDSDEEDD